MDQIRSELDQLLQTHDSDSDPARFLAGDMDEAIAKLTAPWSDPSPQVLPADVLRLAWLHWYRSKASADNNAHELDRAVRFFALLWKEFPDSRDSVPQPLRNPVFACAEPETILENIGPFLAGSVPPGFTADPWAVALELLEAVAAYAGDDAHQGRAWGLRGSMLLDRYTSMLAERSEDDPDLLDEAVAAARHAVALTPGDETFQPAHQVLLGRALDARSWRPGHEDDLDGAIEYLGLGATSMAAERGDYRIGALRELVDTLVRRGERDQRVADFEAAFEVQKTLWAETPTVEVASNLASITVSRLDLGQDVPAGDTDLADEALERALDGSLPRESASPGKPSLADLQTLRARMNISRFIRTQRAEDLDRAIPVAEAACAGAEPGERFDLLGGAALLYGARAETRGDPHDSDEAVRLFEQALSELPAGDQRETHARISLAAGLASRAGRQHRLADAERAEYLLGLIPPDLAAGTRYGPRVLNYRALAVGAQFRLREPADAALLDRAIALHRDALNLATAQPAQARSLRADLATLLTTRFERDGQPDDIQTAIASLRETVDGTPAGDPLLASRQAKLAEAILQLYKADAEVGLLDDVVTARDAALVADPDNSGYEYELGAALAIRSEKTGSEADVVAAISHHRAAVAGATDAAQRANRMASLGSALSVHAGMTGTPELLDEAVTVLGEAVEGAANTSSPELHRSLVNLGVALIRRYEWQGGFEDLEAGVDAYRRALRELPAEVQTKVNLANALDLRAERTGSTSDAEEVMRLREEIIVDTPAGHPQRAGRLRALAGALIPQALNRSDPDLAARAVALCREAVTAATGELDRRQAQTTLANYLLVQARLTDSADLLRTALGELAADPPDGEAFNVRGLIHRQLYELTKDISNLGDAIRDASRASEAAGPQIERVRWRYNLASALATRYEAKGRPPDRTQDLDEAVGIWRAVAEDRTASIDMRFSAAARWGHQAAEAKLWPTASAGYRQAVDLLPQMAWPGLRRQDQEAQLAQASGVARAAAAVAVASGQPEVAVELLEQGRSVLWNLAIEINTELSQLIDAAPDLAAEFSAAQAALRAFPGEEVEGPGRTSDQDDQRVAIARRRDELLARVRSIPGLEDVFRTPRFDRLKQAAAAGPVIILNTSSLRADAIIVTIDRPPLVIPLPDATESVAAARGNAYLDALMRLQRPSSGSRKEAEEAIDSVLHWLWRAVARPVLAGLSSLLADRPPGTTTPRVWWCPTGAFAVFPLHAAGGSMDNGVTEAVIDHVISSYTSSLRALIDARSRPAPDADPRRLMIAVPQAPGMTFLPNAEPELTRISDETWTSTVLVQEQATRARVLEELPRHQWVHFSCHGVQDFARPSRGGLALIDGFLTVQDFRQGMAVSADLAFLSACQTAISGSALFDESIHLAAALQAVGFRHCVATLWSIYDGSSPGIAAAFYRALTDSGHPDARDAAAALHHALREARKRYPHVVTVWAPYIHIGP